MNAAQILQHKESASAYHELEESTFTSTAFHTASLLGSCSLWNGLPKLSTISRAYGGIIQVRPYSFGSARPFLRLGLQYSANYFGSIFAACQGSNFFT